MDDERSPRFLPSIGKTSSGFGNTQIPRQYMERMQCSQLSSEEDSLSKEEFSEEESSECSDYEEHLKVIPQSCNGRFVNQSVQSDKEMFSNFQDISLRDVLQSNPELFFKFKDLFLPNNENLVCRNSEKIPPEFTKKDLILEKEVESRLSPSCEPISLKTKRNKPIKPWKSSNDISKALSESNNLSLVEHNFQQISNSLVEPKDSISKFESSSLVDVLSTNDREEAVYRNPFSCGPKKIYRSELFINLTNSSHADTGDQPLNDGNLKSKSDNVERAFEQRITSISSSVETSNSASTKSTSVDCNSTSVSAGVTYEILSNQTKQAYLGHHVAAEIKRKKFMESHINEQGYHSNDHLSPCSSGERVIRSPTYYQQFRPLEYVNLVNKNKFRKDWSPAHKMMYKRSTKRDIASQTSSTPSLREELKKELSSLFSKKKSRKCSEQELLESSLDMEFSKPSCTCSPSYVKAKKKELTKSQSFRGDKEPSILSLPRTKSLESEFMEKASDFKVAKKYNFEKHRVGKRSFSLEGIRSVFRVVKKDSFINKTVGDYKKHSSKDTSPSSNLPTASGLAMTLSKVSNFLLY